MTDDPVWSICDKLVSFADTELECEKIIKDVKTTPADEFPNDNERGAENERGSVGNVLNRSK